MITGKLDNEDLLRIENHLKTLENSNNALVPANNEQVKINKLFEDRINNLTKQAYRQSRELNSIIKQARLSFRQTHRLETPSRAEHHFQHRHDPSVVGNNLRVYTIVEIGYNFWSELEFATQILESQGIVIESHDQIDEFLEPIALHNDSCKTPKHRHGEYVKLQIETIPKQNKIIPIKATKAIVGNNESYLIIHPCTAIEKSIICDVQNLFNVSNDRCLHEILRGKPGNCTLTKYLMKSETKTIENPRCSGIRL